MEKIANKTPIKPENVKNRAKQYIHFVVNDSNKIFVVDCFIKDVNSITQKNQVANFKSVVEESGFTLDKDSIEFIPKEEMKFVDFCDIFEFGEPSYMFGNDLNQLSERLAEFLPKCQEVLPEILEYLENAKQDMQKEPQNELSDRCYQ